MTKASIDTIESNRILQVPVSMFKDAYGKRPERDCLLSTVLIDIRDGRYAEEIRRGRELFALWKDEDPNLANKKLPAAKAYASFKKTLAAFCMSGTASDRKSPLVHSGMVQIDLDTLIGPLEKTREQAKQDPYVAFGFVSPSGDRLKLGYRIDGNRHDESFEAAQYYFEINYGITIDPSTSDRLRLCFISHDPGLWTNPEAMIFKKTPPNNSSECCILNPAALDSASLHTASLDTASLDTASLDTASLDTASLDNSPVTILENISARREAEKLFASKYPQLAGLYSQFIEQRFTAIAGARNHFITQAVPFLYRAVAKRLVSELVMHFYDCNRPLFQDSREDHLKETSAMLIGVAETYSQELSTSERSIYAALEEHEQDAFRICRDLALISKPEREQMTFFLSFNHLSNRLGIFPMQALRVVRRMEIDGLLKQIKKGTRRAAGVRAQAGEYRWLLVPSIESRPAKPKSKIQSVL